MLEGYSELFRATGNMLPVAVGILTATYLIPRWFNSTTYQLKHIPTVGGSSGVILSYFSALRYYLHGHEMVQEGYNKYYGSAFKVPTMSEWLVIVSGSQMIEDIRRASDDYMTPYLSELLQADYTVGPTITADSYHFNFLRAPLARHLGNYDADIKDEIACTVGDLLPVKENGRNSEYLQLSEKFSTEGFFNSQILNMFPKSLLPIVGRPTANKAAKTIKHVEFHIRPLVEACLEQKRRDGDSESNDSSKIISWLIDEAQASQRPLDTEDFTRRILATNSTSVGGTTAALTDALFNLAAYPEYVEPMREEVEAIVGAEGWTKASIAKMRKVDSFIKETMRTGTGSATGNRKLLKDFTFSNGISLPAGTYIAFASRPIHHDAKHYDSPTEFRGFRFVDMADEDYDDPKNQVAALTSEYVIFGAGRHACPGRFFAAYMLKVSLAYIVLNYDVEYPGDGSRPTQTWFQAVLIPDGTAELVFKKRA